MYSILYEKILWKAKIFEYFYHFLYFSNTAQQKSCAVFEKVICFIIVALTLKKYIIVQLTYSRRSGVD
jgi:hypothetical protein